LFLISFLSHIFSTKEEEDDTLFEREREKERKKKAKQQKP
tara:strand:- start:617 stop:736 length:120 start_codon:yes stop_codon:yes gene_type:complete